MVIEATPPPSAAVPSSVVPSIKLTVPLAVVGAMVAVKVMVLRNRGVFGVIVAGVVVSTKLESAVPASGFTVWLSGEEEESLAVKFWSPV